MSTTLRAARPDDAGFLAWVALAASRSHVERGAFDLLIESGDEERLHFLEALLVSEQRHWCHYTGFRLAEVEGLPAAALSGYPAHGEALQSSGEAIASCARGLGWTDGQLQAAFTRLAVFLECLPDDAAEAWIVEWVATRPEYRRRGLVQGLLDAEFENGRERGHPLAQIMILCGNTPAQLAYERAGFSVADEKRSARFEEAVGCPGLVRMLRPL